MSDMPNVNVGEVVKTLVLEGSIKEEDMSYALGIVFNNYMRHTIRGHNNITNHYIEEGTAIQDTSTTDPLTITVQGWMADLSYSMNPKFEEILSKIVQTANFPIIGGFVATRLSSVLYIVNLIYEQVRNLIDTYNKYQDMYKQWRSKGEGATTQVKNRSGYTLPFITFDEDMNLGYQTAVLENLRISRLPVDLVLPRVGTFHNMYVEDYEWDQDKAYYQAKITLTLKQVRTTQTKLTELSTSTVKRNESEAGN